LIKDIINAIYGCFPQCESIILPCIPLQASLRIRINRLQLRYKLIEWSIPRYPPETTGPVRSRGGLFLG
jgi:hypothetical protein